MNAPTTTAPAQQHHAPTPEAAPSTVLSPQLEQALADSARRFEPRDFGELERLAERAYASRLFAVQSAEAALCIMLTGASLGLSPIVALRSIHVVEGRPVLSSDLIAAVVMRSGIAARWECVETTAERCVLETERRGQAGVRRHEWTMAMAQRAGLAGRGTWTKYPAAMLRARCTAELGRIVYPDVLAGVYVEGEIGGEAEEPSAAQPESPAFEAFRAELTAATGVWAIWSAYVDLADALRAEGSDPREWLDGPRGAAQLSASRLRDVGLVLSVPETTALLAVRDAGAFAQALDGVLGVPALSAGPAAAAWWLACREGMPRDVATVVYTALARRLVGSGEPDSQETKKGKAALALAVAEAEKALKTWLAEREGLPRDVAATPAAPAAASVTAPAVATQSAEVPPHAREPGDDDEDGDALAAFRTDVAALATAQDAVVCWTYHHDDLVKQPKDLQAQAWDLIAKRVEALGQRPGKAWLTKAIKAAIKPPPKGPGGAPHPEAPASADADAKGSAALAPAGAGPLAHAGDVITSHGEVLDTEAAMRRHLAGLTHAIAVVNSWLRHRGESATYDRLCALRLMALEQLDATRAQAVLDRAWRRQHRDAA